jgi:hypothetical protein
MTHVPSRIIGDQAETIEARAWPEARAPFLDRVLDEVENYAPGFRQLVLAAEAQAPDDLQAANENLVGGDIGSGSYSLDQQLVFRPLPGWFRYKTPIDRLYISGAATHPGGGVHGAPGANAARVLLADLRLADTLRPARAIGARFTRAGAQAGGWLASQARLARRDHEAVPATSSASLSERASAAGSRAHPSWET